MRITNDLNFLKNIVHLLFYIRIQKKKKKTN